jgi:F-type H+-transporting ATPase subunit delta
MAAVAQLYARAFADVADKAGLDRSAAMGQLDDFGAAFASSSDLREIMANPSVPLEQKLRVLDSLCDRLHAVKQVRNFLAVLLQKGRMGELQEILAETQSQLDVHGHVIEAEVSSAQQLTDAQQKTIEAAVAKNFGSGTGKEKVRASYKLDAKLLGGVTVKVGSTVYDGSIQGQLRRLKEQLTAQ